MHRNKVYINWYSRILTHIHDIHRSVDPVPCHGRFESLTPGYVQVTGKNKSQLSPVVIESNDGISKINFSNNFAVHSMNKVGLSSCSRKVLLIVFKLLIK